MLRRILARLGAVLVRLDKPKPKPGPNDNRYGFPEHHRWQPPNAPSRLGWLDQRNPDRSFGPEVERF